MALALFFFTPWLVQNSAYITDENVPIEQPVPFSHRHHVSELGIDCRYCHWNAEVSSFAGMPSTDTCMSCHSQIWHDSPMLEPVRASFRTGRPIAWNRVYRLPDFVYFNHSIHLSKGVGCTTCHANIGTMTLTWATAPLKMSWCLNCHLHPEQYLRPRDQIFSTRYSPPRDQKELGLRLAREYQVQKLTDCVTCHR